MTIPCIKEKCLKFPICRYKKAVGCSLLCDYIVEMKIDGDVTWWNENIKVHFHNLLYTYVEQKTIISGQEINTRGRIQTKHATLHCE